MSLAMLYAIPFFLLFIGLEWWAGRRRHQQIYRLNDTITNLNIGIGQQATGLFLKMVLLFVYVKIHENFSIYKLPANTLTFVLCLILFDFAFYWAHRFGHTINFFWGAHSVHHQSEEYNLSVALRQSWFHSTLSFFIFLPIAVLGFDPKIFAAAAGVNILYQFWIHTQMIDKLPRWIEYIFNTPSHHRVHHAVNKQYIDRNHAGMFIVWDKMFGTFEEEREKPIYGITEPLKSWNPVWANFQYYVLLWQKMRHFTRWRDKLYLWLAPPGWQPDELGGLQPPPDIHSERPKYNADTSKPMRRYIVAQFMVIITGLSAYIYYFSTITPFYRVSFLGLILLSMLICGAIFEQKKWAWLAEHARLLVVAVSLNSFYYFWYQQWFIVMLIASAVCFAFFNMWLLRANRLLIA